ncbi:hypothetical protein J5X84_41845 [Streptosporangiaceae bacterium NEAU-GS5]|nr:hypothetical protein [Streptosporangiaceae bacterium NEAU-GS5]
MGSRDDAGSGVGVDTGDVGVGGVADASGLVDPSGMANGGMGEGGVGAGGVGAGGVDGSGVDGSEAADISAPSSFSRNS